MTAALYPCQITHARSHPIRRTFRYRSYLWLAGLDDLAPVPLPLRPLARFQARDHLGGTGGSLRAGVDAYLERQGISLAGGRVLMLGHARVLGYVFNPLTVFWCHRADGTLAAVIAEVHNTYVPAGRRAVPAAPAPAGDHAAAVTRCATRGSPRRYARSSAGRASGSQPGTCRSFPARPLRTRRCPMTTATAPMPRPSPDGQAAPPAPGTQPAVPAVPRGPVALARAAIARAFLSQAAARLPIRIQDPGGKLSGVGGPGSPVLTIHDQDAFYRRLGGGTAGLAGGYMAGDWDSPDLVGLFTVFAENLAGLVPAPLQALRRWYIPASRLPRTHHRRCPAQHRTALRPVRRVVRLFLDPSMTYSSALFAPGDTLAAAQRRKIETLLDRTGTGPGTTVLEIGTGWGALAVAAAARGAQVTTLAISPSQYATARRRAAAAGAADRVDVQLRDYRQATGRYDVILSVEMIEAVGERYWPAYFSVLDRLLAPGGRVGLQAITMPHDRMLATRGGHTWIHKYIFPGGQIPSLQSITDTLREHISLRVTADYPMGPHYARTLAEWRRQFLAAGNVSALGFGPVFQRMWNLYLAYSEAGFRAGYLDLHQLVLERGW